MNRKTLKLFVTTIAAIFMLINCATGGLPGGGLGGNYGTTITYVPSNLPNTDVPLVVAIHGCSQSATDYQSATGWNNISDKYGFIVMYPHKISGKIMNCWDHANTGTGNPSSDMNYIISEIDKIKQNNNIDENRIFVTGLSSGGGMTYCLMEHHGDIFAGAAPMAAPLCSQSPGSPNNEKMLIWHSPSDSYSDGSQGFNRYGSKYSGASKTISNEKLKNGHSGHKYDAYTKDGKEVVGLVTISMSHGISVDPGSGEDQGGNSGKQYTYDMGIHSSYYSAKFWGLLSNDPGTVDPDPVDPEDPIDPDPEDPEEPIDPGYTEQETATATAHYTAGRVSVSQYIQLGTKYGYIATFTLYKIESGEWVDEL